MTKYKKESLLLQFFKYLFRNPGTAISLAYLLLTLCGLYYSITFFAQFDIPILKLADVSDLLIAGISEPAAMVMFCGGILVAVFIDILIKRSFEPQKRWRNEPASLKRTVMLIILYAPELKSTVVMYIAAAFLVYSYFFVYAYADWQGDQIKAGHGYQVILTGESVATNTTGILLGSTTNFVMVYDVEAQQAAVYPVESLSLIQPLKDKANTEKINQAAAKKAGSKAIVKPQKSMD